MFLYHFLRFSGDALVRVIVIMNRQKNCLLLFSFLLPMKTRHFSANFKPLHCENFRIFLHASHKLCYSELWWILKCLL